MESMNAGKGMAQATHAANAFVHEVTRLAGTPNQQQSEKDQVELYEKWRDETLQGFGTCIVLGVNEAQMNSAVDVASKCDFIAGVAHDPSYPLRDGSICHFLPIDTCAYVFGDKNDPTLSAILGNFGLHP